MQIDLVQRIIQTAEAQGGYISTRQIRALGASKAWIERQVRAGWLRRVRRGVYRIGPPSLDYNRSAAIGWGGVDAMMLGVHGLDVWQLRSVDVSREPIEVWAPTRLRSRGGVKYAARTWITPDDAREVDGLRVARREVCIATVAGSFEPIDLVKLIKEACFRDRRAAHKLEVLVKSRPVPYSARIVTALDWYKHGHCGFDSATEKRVARRLRELGAAPFMINAYVCLADGELRIDVYWPDAGLVMEVNPDGHKREWVRISDLGRIARLERDGLETISLDTTRHLAEQDVVLRRAANRSHQLRTGLQIEWRKPVRS